MAKKDNSAKKDSIEAAREALLAKINKTFKSDVVRKFTITEKMERISTSYFLLDEILGGGIPVGRIVEFYGWESSGKSFLSTKIMASAQAQDRAVFLFDAENGFHRDFAVQCGLDVENGFGYSDEQSATKIFDTIRMICQANLDAQESGEPPLYDVIVVDSVASLLTEYEESHGADKAKIGDLAGVMSRNLKKLPGIASKSKTTIIFINQVRNNIGVMYGDPETTPGGNALKFYSSVRLKLRRLGGADGKITKGKDLVGHKVVATVVKNKTAPPHRKAEFSIFYDGTTDDTEDILTMGENYNIISHIGNTFLYTRDNGEEVKAIGKPKMLDAIREGGEELRDELVVKIKEKLDTNLSSDELEDVKQEESWTEDEEDDKFSLESDLSDFDED